MFEGFCRLTNRQTNICDFRVAFASEKVQSLALSALFIQCNVQMSKLIESTSLSSIMNMNLKTTRGLVLNILPNPVKNTHPWASKELHLIHWRVMEWLWQTLCWLFLLVSNLILWKTINNNYLHKDKYSSCVNKRNNKIMTKITELDYPQIRLCSIKFLLCERWKLEK